MPKARKKAGGTPKALGPRSRSNSKRHAPASRTRAPATPHASAAELLTPTVRARELFWFNVVREILMSLWAASEKPSTWKVQNQDRGDSPSPTPAAADLLDGRFSIVTNTGLRVPIAQVQPVFGCGVLDKASKEHWLSQAVECTVFQIRTPQGEVFTLPIHAVRAFHSLSEESMDQLGQSTREAGDESPGAPFGFAAYTSLARTASGSANDSNVDPRWFHTASE